MRAHSRLGPSSSDRWVECPASVALSEQFPTLIEHPSAPEGVAAHWVASSMLLTHAPLEGEIAPNGVAVTQEMLEGALLYYNHVFRIANPHGSMTARFRWEQPEQMPSIHPEMWGTPDGAGVVDTLDTAGELHIVDYKFGHGEVSPVENWQLVSYARGVLDRLGFNGHDEQFIRVHCHIVQPRCYTASGPIRSWSATAGDLRAMWNRLSMSAHEALGDKPRYKVGKHCKHCPGRRACPTLKREVADIMDRAEYELPIEIPVTDLGLELSMVERSLALMEARVAGLREQVEANVRAGQQVPGWGMKAGRPAVSWAAPLEEVFALGDMFGVDLRKTTAPTPKQAADLLRKKGIDASVIDAYSATTPGKMSLAPDDFSQLKKVFSK